MARIVFQWAAIAAALLILSACRPSADSDPAPTATPTPPTLNVFTAVNSQPGITSTPDHAPFSGPLSVIILEPADNEVVHQALVALVGKADPGTVVTINEDVILVDKTGSFTINLSLSQGDNLIEITASTAEKDQDFSYMNVIYEPNP